MTAYAQHGKRILDVVMATGALVLLSPVMAGVTVAIRKEDGGPILFRQERAGSDNQPFTLLKFRSMGTSAIQVPSSEGAHLAVTKVGRFIRRFNIDELPQFVNVLRGEMSVIGPRPALPQQSSLLELRATGGSAALRPGLTGLAQVNSYDGMPPTEKAKWDNMYADKLSLTLDLKIIWRTIGYFFSPPPTY